MYAFVDKTKNEYYLNFQLIYMFYEQTNIGPMAKWACILNNVHEFIANRFAFLKFCF